MDKKYIELFKELSTATALSAEQVMDYDKNKNDDDGFKAAQIMRDNYENLKNKIIELNDSYTLDKSDAAKLVIAAIILVNQLTDRINNIQRVIDNYQNDLIPNLQKIVDESENDEQANKLANSIFIIENDIT